MAEAPSPTSSPTSNTPCLDTTLDLNIAVIVAALLCALLCALGLNSMLHCVLQCTQRLLTEHAQWVASRRINSGLKQKDIVTLPTSTYENSGSPPSVSGCAICLLDFSEGEKLRMLPKCNHRFHAVCIDKWLFSHSTCPNCRVHLKTNTNTSAVSCSLEILVTTS